MSEKEIKEILTKAYELTQTFEIQDLVLMSENYAQLLDEIGKSQGFATFELTEENEERFGLILKEKRRYIITLYKNANTYSKNNGFIKESLRSIPENSIYNGAVSMMIQFFALIRNKEKRLNETENVITRRDEMRGIANHMERMNVLITKGINL